MGEVKVATRGSQLALTQTGWVVDQLREAHPGVSFAIEIYKTVGDRVVDVALSRIGEKGLFTKELEEALIDGRADMAIHSLKDLPGELPEHLTIGAVVRREDARDVVVTLDGTRLCDLPPSTVVGTSSLRRTAQLRAQRPDLVYVPLRGNLDTRMRKLREGQAGALVLAAAGLHRLGLAAHITEYLESAFCLPAPGQGALAVEIRRDDKASRALLGAVHDPRTAQAVAAERALLARLQGGCQVPIGALAEHMGEHLHLEGLIASPDGARLIRYAAEAPAHEAKALGERVALWLLAHGGEEILAQLRS